MCDEQFKGQLVEIRNDAEYNFFQDFLRWETQCYWREHIMLGARYHDDGDGGTWRYVSSKEEFRYR